jgi:Domain of unknown function (DUF1707)
MDTTPRGYPAGQIRVSDADRDAAASELGEHFQAGRLTVAELDERAGQALSARTGDDLADLFSDLPAGSAALARTAAGQRPRPAAGVAGPAAGLRRAPWRSRPATGIAMLAVIAAVITVLASVPGHEHGRWAPWWLLPLAFVLLRRLAWSGRAQAARQAGDSGG